MKSTFKILFYLKRKAPRKDGSVPVMCRIRINGTIAQFSCKFYVDPEVWDICNSQPQVNTSDTRLIKRKVSEIKKGIEKHYKKIFNGVGPLIADRVRISYLGLDRSCRTILQVFDLHNKDYIRLVETNCRSISTYRKYCIAYQHLKQYINSEYKMKDIALTDLHYNFITGFEIFLRKKRLCATNTVCLYVYPLRKMIAISKDNGWLDYNPFSGYYIKAVKTERGYLTTREINMLIKAEFAQQRYSMIRDFFVFCCFTGVPHIDFRLLTRANLKRIDGKWWLSYMRHKTNIPCNLRLLDIPLNIVKKYKGSTGSDKLFPMPNVWSVNKQIKIASKLAGIKKDVTWHVARHSFATEICLMNGVSIEVISRMLGHSDIKTTQIYTRISDTIIDRDMDILAEKLNNIFI